MSGARWRWAALGFAAVLAHGCVLEGGGVGIEAAAPYGFDYYEPPGVFYGGWGPGYYVAPFRDRDHDHDRHFERGPGFREGRAGPRAFRAAPAGRAIPSIPTGPRFGGTRGGGSAHFGGAHGDGPHR